MVLIPTYNEDPAVLRCSVAGVIAAGYPVLVIDDGSVPAVCRKDLPASCVLLRHAVNLGQGAALQTGIEYARRRELPWLVSFDADGQHRAEDIARVLAPLRTAAVDLVFGSRFLRREDRRAIPWFRRTVLRCGRIFNGLVSGVWMTDAHCGLRAFGPRALEKIQLRENRMAYATELLWHVRRGGLRWREVAVHADYTAYSIGKGQSSWNAFGIAFTILKRRLRS